MQLLVNGGVMFKKWKQYIREISTRKNRLNNSFRIMEHLKKQMLGGLRWTPKQKCHKL